MPDYVLILIRSVISFIVLLALTRAMGKKQLSQLTFFDYVIGITIGSIAASMSADLNIQIFNGVISLAIWGLFSIILGYFGLKSRKFLYFTDGKPSIVIKNGEIFEEELKKNAMAIDELMMLLREKDIFNVADVEMAIFETNGELSVLPKTSAAPVTPTTLGLKVKNETSPILLIVDGHVLSKNLILVNKDEKWLLKQLKKQNVFQIEDVFLAQVDAKNNLYVDLYEDKKN